MSGALEPGTRLREIPLSQHFDVSTTPVREALRRLEAEGLAEVSPRRGAVVTRFDESRIRELYELREILEMAAARKAAVADADLAALTELYRSAGNHLGEDDQAAFYELDVQFHRTIGDLGGNTELAAAAEKVHRQIQSVRARHALRSRTKVAHRQHKKLLDAIRAGDADAAADAVRVHIGSAAEHVITTMRRDQSPG